jgi:hypothetical protein
MIVDVSHHLGGVGDAVTGAVDLNYVRMLRFLGFCIKKGLTYDLSFSCPLCTQEYFSRRKKRSYSLS